MKESLPARFILVIMSLWMNTLLFGQEMNLLPEGRGLAAAFHGDRGIDHHPEVLFYDGFEDSSSLDRWDHVWARDGTGEIVRVTGQTGGDGHAYQASIYRPAERGGSVGIRKFLEPGYDRLFLRYYAKYKAGLEIYHGGTHNAGSIAARLPDELFESHAGIYPDGYNIYSIILDTWRPDTNTKSPGNIAFYCYHMDQGHQWGDHFFPSGITLPRQRDLFGDRFIPRSDFIPETGKWYCYELMIIPNNPGKHDGRIAFWVDGNLMGDFPNLRFRETKHLKPNRIALSLYTHNQRNTTDLIMWFDDVVAATSYIGPKSN